MTQTLIYLSRPPTKEEIKNGFTSRHEKYVDLKEFDYRKRWIKIDGHRWTNKGLVFGEIK